MQYKIIEPNDDVTAVKIEKSGITTIFTLAEVQRDVLLLEKMQKELTGQRDLDDSKIKNVEEFHPFVLSMSPEDLSTASLYFDCKGRFNQCVGKLEQIKKALEDGDVERKEIFKQLPELKTK